MTGRIRAVVLDTDKDNVAVALADLEPEETVCLTNCNVTLREKIPYQHKFSIKFIQHEEKIIKVGEIIGKATQDIQLGFHVHIHNMTGLRARREV
jgi:altronate dehydratase small subunit